MPPPAACANDLPDVKTGARSTAAACRTVTSGAFSASVTAALQRLDTSGWSGRSDRLAVLQQLLGPQLGPHAPKLFEALARFHVPMEMPGPTGESNRLRYTAREPTLCVGPDWQPAIWQAAQALAAGGGVLLLVSAPLTAPLTGQLRSWEAAGLPIGAVEAGPAPDDSDWLQSIGGFGVLAFSGPSDRAKSLRLALARRDGEIKPLVTDPYAPLRYVHERLICIDTTAAGGNASLLAASESDGPASA
jgi:RHH-type proline utilization regulon transcriptional repressor/proline dehydrogenase/delta 1-pyrroline-5-carboxylate dehydrogenase